MIRITVLMLFLAQGTTDASGLVVAIGETPSERLNPLSVYAPGAPPLLSFRYFDASDRGRFGNMGLMTEDAGH